MLQSNALSVAATREVNEVGVKISRKEYAELFGPTTGDRIRLGDTDLWAEVEADLITPGDECVFGGGKSLRDGLGSDGAITAAQGALDFVITNVLIIDAVVGIVKADIGIRDGRIVGIGKAGNPKTMDGVSPDLIVGANTDVRSAEGLIATAGAIDVHVHFDSVGLCEEAISSGVTTMIGGGLGPVTVGICSSGTTNLGRMLQASEAWPINFGFLGKGSAHATAPLLEQGKAGAIGLKIHEDWGGGASRDQVKPRCWRRTGHPNPDPHRHAQRVGLLRAHDVSDRRPNYSHIPL